MTKTYDEDEVKALVAKAVADATTPLQAKLDEVDASKAQEAHDAEIAELKSAHEAELASLKSELDTVKVTATEFETKLNDTVSYLEAEKAAADEAATIEARKTERLEAVKEVASFDDAYLTENIDRWSAMADDDFEALTASWKAVKATVGNGERQELSSELPPESAMLTGRETVTKGATRKEILGLRNRGIDPRTLV